VPGPCRWRLLRRVLPDEPVDSLAQQVGVADVPGVLVVQVDHDAPQVRRRAAARANPDTASALARACPDHRQVGLGYGSEWDAEVDPWAVVVRHGRWYLLCWSHTSIGRRAYRIDRIRAVEVHSS
jgi:predicted DNA-binding transcriptional regulator YafY